MKLYLAGPMSGLPDWNFPVFNELASKLRDLGHVVFNPAENVREDNHKGRAYYMKKDIHAIIGSTVYSKPTDAVAVLRNWESSRGTRLEVEIALQLDIPVLWADELANGNIVLLTQEELNKTLDINCDTYMSILNEGVAA